MPAVRPSQSALDLEANQLSFPPRSLAYKLTHCAILASTFSLLFQPAEVKAAQGNWLAGDSADILNRSL